MLKFAVAVAGLEPTTFGMRYPSSIQLSYTAKKHEGQQAANLLAFSVSGGVRRVDLEELVIAHVDVEQVVPP